MLSCTCQKGGVSAARKMKAQYAIVMHVKPASSRSLQKLADSNSEGVDIALTLIVPNDQGPGRHEH
jgi:hypothetical protein